MRVLIVSVARGRGGGRELELAGDGQGARSVAVGVPHRLTVGPQAAAASREEVQEVFQADVKEVQEVFEDVEELDREKVLEISGVHSAG